MRFFTKRKLYDFGMWMAACMAGTILASPVTWVVLFSLAIMLIAHSELQDRFVKEVEADQLALLKAQGKLKEADDAHPSNEA